MVISVVLRSRANYQGARGSVPYITRGGVRIHYEVEGAGPPVVMLGGLSGPIEILALAGFTRAFPDYELILIDPRGHGRSDKPTDPKAHRIEEYRDDVLGVMDAAQVERAVCWGISDGAKVCLALADAYPHRVVAVIVHDGFEDTDLSAPEGREDRLSLAREIRRQGYELRRALARSSASQGFPIPPAILKEQLSEDFEMAVLELEAWTEWQGPVSVLARSKVPILLLMSEKGMVRPGAAPEGGRIERRSRAASDRAEIHVVPGINHQEICFKAEHTVPIIRSFLARLPS